MTNELALIELPNAATLFDGTGMDAILNGIKEKVKSYDLDVTTEAGRKEIASVAYKVAKSKTAIDDQGKELVSGIKEEAKKIDSERKKARDYLDALKAEIRQPLTDFEEAEKTRVSELQERITNLKCACEQIPETSEGIKSLIKRVKTTAPETFQEFEPIAAAAKSSVMEALSDALAKAEKSEAEAIELEKLRKEKAERELKDREEAIRAEAEEKAKVEAERKANAEAAEIKAKHKARIAELQAMEAESIEAERKRILEVERQHAEAIEKTKADAAEKAALIQAEANALAATKLAEEKAEEKRQANKKHRAKIKAETIEALMTCWLSNDEAENLFNTIEAGGIPNITINY
tara:strand:+ start:2342 stop:3391 length:1050 start_codon:yes stop_codon:yes gene_type:complete